MAMTLAGCAGLNSVTRSLPPAPGYLQPVAVTEPHQGEACVAYAARERAGRLTANKTIEAGRDDWNAISASYAKGTAK